MDSQKILKVEFAAVEVSIDCCVARAYISVFDGTSYGNAIRIDKLPGASRRRHLHYVASVPAGSLVIHAPVDASSASIASAGRLIPGDGGGFDIDELELASIATDAAGKKIAIINDSEVEIKIEIAPN